MNIKKYLKECQEIYHLTLDPKAESVIRIHLIPPKKRKINIPWVVILNGYYILPLGKYAQEKGNEGHKA